MSIFNTVKQLLSGRRVEFAWSDSSTISVTESVQSGPVSTEWETTEGQLHHPSQTCRVSYDNNAISGSCTGNVGELTGAVMIGCFDNLPAWLPSLLVRVTVQVAEGELTVSTREPDGVVVRTLSPSTFEANAELVNGRIRLWCEAGLTAARGISYEVVII